MFNCIIIFFSFIFPTLAYPSSIILKEKLLLSAPKFSLISENLSKTSLLLKDLSSLTSFIKSPTQYSLLDKVYLLCSFYLLKKKV